MDTRRFAVRIPVSQLKPEFCVLGVSLFSGTRVDRGDPILPAALPPLNIPPTPTAECALSL